MLLTILLEAATTPDSDGIVGDGLNKLVQLNDKLMNAPGGVLIIIMVAAVGLALRKWHRFPNNIVPLIQIAIGFIVWLGFALGHFPEETGFRKVMPWFSTNICIGLILPTISWAATTNIIKFVEKKYGIKIDDATQFNTMSDLQKPTEQPKDKE
jgi:hypothetical protein